MTQLRHNERKWIVGVAWEQRASEGGRIQERKGSSHSITIHLVYHVADQTSELTEDAGHVIHEQGVFAVAEAARDDKVINVRKLTK